MANVQQVVVVKYFYRRSYTRYTTQRFLKRILTSIQIIIRPAKLSCVNSIHVVCPSLCQYDGPMSV